MYEILIKINFQNYPNSDFNENSNMIIFFINIYRVEVLQTKTTRLVVLCYTTDDTDFGTPHIQYIQFSAFNI